MAAICSVVGGNEGSSLGRVSGRWISSLPGRDGSMDILGREHGPSQDTEAEGSWVEETQFLNVY